MIGEHVESFGGFPVKVYEGGKGLSTPAKFAWVLTLGDRAWDAPEPLTALIGKFLGEKGVGEVAALVIGPWEEVGSGTGSQEIVATLAAARDRLPRLRALFFGDITVEESEISWIVQSDMGPLLGAYPRLEEFRVRGSEGLKLGALKHAGLRSLSIESGGLPGEVVRQVVAAELPELVHLELWLGSEDYGADWTLGDLGPILSGERFPKLQWLGLRDCERADEVAAAVAQAPILSRLRRLDLSLGNLGDAGGEALLASPAVKRLEKLDLHHHYLSKGVMKRFQALGIQVDVSDPQEARGGDDRFIAVAE